MKKTKDLLGREPYDTANLLCGFAIFRMKGREGGDWDRLDHHGRPDPIVPYRANPQAVVFIALSNLGWENGFFMELNSGQDVCLDIKTGLVYPRTGGGLGVVFWLRL